MAPTAKDVSCPLECDNCKPLSSISGKLQNIRVIIEDGLQLICLQDFDSVQLVNDMIDNPEEWVANLQRYTASIASTVLYGWRTPNVNTGYVKGLVEVSLGC